MPHLVFTSCSNSSALPEAETIINLDLPCASCSAISLAMPLAPVSRVILLANDIAGVCDEDIELKTSKQPFDILQLRNRLRKLEHISAIGHRHTRRPTLPHCQHRTMYQRRPEQLGVFNRGEVTRASLCFGSHWYSTSMRASNTASMYDVRVHIFTYLRSVTVTGISRPSQALIGFRSPRVNQQCLSYGWQVPSGRALEKRIIREFCAYEYYTIPPTTSS